MFYGVTARDALEQADEYLSRQRQSPNPPRSLCSSLCALCVNSFLGQDATSAPTLAQEFSSLLNLPYLFHTRLRLLS